MKRRRFLATVLALPAALTQCSPEPVVPQIMNPLCVERIQVYKILRFNGRRVGVLRSEDGTRGQLVQEIEGRWTYC